MIRRIFGLALAILLLSASTAFALDNAITHSDWAYQTLDGWAQRGLLAGYPAGPLNCPPALTRFEVASLTLRAIEGIGQEYQRRGTQLAQLATPASPTLPPVEPSQPTPPAPATDEFAPLPPTPSPSQAEIQAIERAPGVYPEDIAALEKLVAELRSELAGIGVRVDEIQAMLVELGARVNELQTSLTDTQKTLAETRTRLATVEAEQKRHRISGYLQARFTDDQAQPASTFSIRRARLNVEGPVSPRTSYRIQFELASDSQARSALRDAYIDYLTSKYSRLRVGQAKLPIGYEIPESSSVRLEPERSMVANQLFPDQRDVGLFYHYQERETAAALDAAVVNGTGINTADDSDRKNALVSTHIPLPWGNIAFAGYDGATGPNDDELIKDIFSTGLDLLHRGTWLRGEYFTGRFEGADVLGWYARLSNQFTKHGAMYLKYDTYNENTNAPDQDFRRWSIGWVEELDPRTRLTLHWESRDVDRGFSQFSSFHGDEAIAQLQVRF